MTVIRIGSKWDGYLGLVSKESDIIPFLMDNNYIHEKTLLGFYDEEKDEYYEKYLPELFASDWENVLLNKTLSELRKIFEEYFYFIVETVWTY